MNANNATTIADYENQIETAKTRIQKLTAESDAKQKEIAEKEKEIATAKSTATAEIEKNRQAFEENKKELDDKILAYNRLTTEKDEVMKSQAKLQEQLKQKTNDYETIEKNLDAIITQTKTANEKLQGNITALNIPLGKIKTATGTSGGKNSAKKQMNNMINYTSSMMPSTKKNTKKRRHSNN